MAEIINLRQFRKEALRKTARAKGDENAVKFGRTKAEREIEKSRGAKAARDLDNHRLRDTADQTGAAKPEAAVDLSNDDRPLGPKD